MMKRSKVCFAALALAVPLMLSSCVPGDVAVRTSVGMYFGTSYYDPWFYGPTYRPPVIIRPPTIINRPARPPAMRPPPVPPRPRPPRPPRPMPR
ncbi:MAG: hypothetical protein LBE59_02585 [Nevskiaceae bacterium]|nr:hypothetical protein [Nevskiaceae bacterium]